MFRIDRKYLSAIDWILLANLFLIPFCGLIVLYSAGYDPEGRIFTIPLFSIQIPSLAFVRQLLFLSVGTVVFIVSALLPSSFLQKISYIAFLDLARCRKGLAVGLISVSLNCSQQSS